MLDHLGPGRGGVSSCDLHDRDRDPDLLLRSARSFAARLERNTNGLLRQDLPKGSALPKHTAADLKRIQRSLNDRPRKTLGYMTPSEAYTQVVCSHRLNPPI
jgi:hypothetical protein